MCSTRIVVCTQNHFIRIVIIHTLTAFTQDPLAAGQDCAMNASIIIYIYIYTNVTATGLERYIVLTSVDL